VLSEKSKAVILATLPVVAANIGEISAVFYRRMFAAHPELERDLFNRGNQAQGDQQRALAGSIAAYATLLVSDMAPDQSDLVSRVANKHASLGIRADQYDIVHKFLFGAIEEVLGDAVTEDVAAAWDEVYWHMARALISMEDELYADAGVEPGDIWLDLEVRQRTQESPDSVSFVLASPGGDPLPVSHPGQYVSVAVTLPDGARQIRQYSLTRAPERMEWRITVKAVAEAVAEDGTRYPPGEVSNYLHENLFEGDKLSVSLPFGDLTLEDGSDPLLLVSAGIGCTPIIGMLHHLARTGTEREVVVLHADRSPARHAHREELAELVAKLPGSSVRHWYEDLDPDEAGDTTSQGLIDLQGVDVPTDAQVYLCGPLPFMEKVRRSLLHRGIPDRNIHYEVFGPDTWLASA
jgi:nitric oxide dioxygenase